MLKPKGHRCHRRFLDDPTSLPLAEKSVKADITPYLHPGLSTEAFRREPYTGHGPSVSYALGTQACAWHAKAELNTPHRGGFASMHSFGHYRETDRSGKA